MDTYNTPDKMAYIAENGWHFNKKACEEAVRMMKRKGSSGKPEPLEPWSKEQVDELLNKYGVKLENKIGYDYVYVANMLKSDNLKGSIPDEAHLALGVKEAVDDIDAGEGEIFACWYVKMIRRRLPVDWGAYL
jgi:hypothetical protein